MKYVLTAEHHHYFQKNHCLELEELLSNAQLEGISASIESAILQKTNTPKEQFHRLSAAQRFMAGYDLWRSDPHVAKIVTGTHLAEIAANLTHHRTLRLGCDQWFPATPPLPSQSGITSAFDELLTKTMPLSEFCCLLGACSALMLCISGTGTSPTENYEGVFPHNPGSGIYFTAEKAIDFPTLRHRPGQQFLLIIYTERTTLYTVQQSDPHLHELKKLGYVFGDRLNDRLNPILIRN
jgi:hypothetical protein